MTEGGARTAVLASAARVIAAVVDQGASADAALAAVAPVRRTSRRARRGTGQRALVSAPAACGASDCSRRKAGRLAPEVSALADRRSASDRVFAQSGAVDGQCRRQCGARAGTGARGGPGQCHAAPLRARARDAVAAVDADPVAAAAHPAWLAAALRRAWPQQAARVMAANNAHPPMTLRVDVTRIGRDDYVALLTQAGIEARASDWAHAAVELTAPVGVAALPHFAEGWVSVQDSGAQLAARAAGCAARHARAGRVRGAGRQDAAHPRAQRRLAK